MKSPIRRWFPWVIGLFPLAAMLTVGVLFLTDWTKAGRVLDGQRRAVADHIAALRSAKIARPVLFEPAEEGNSWDLIAPALKAISEIPDQELVCLPSYEMWRPEDAPEPGLGETEKLMEKLGPHLETLKRALRRPSVEPPFDFDNPVNHDTSIGSGTVRTAEILRDLTALALEQGKAEKAVELVILTLGIADRIAVKSFLMRDQMAMVASSRGLDALKDALEKHNLSVVHLSRMASVLDSVDSGREVDWVDKED
ncbi:MAG TPA: hypothetical protein VFS19_04340, partial [Planctomycetota bacterium]|nr:hypothetical protein [Planctomycetota bacterium]